MVLRVVLALSLSICVTTAIASAQELAIATDATKTQPLEKGQKAPDVTLQSTDGKDVSLASLYQEKPLIIVFFRGGWCPFCTKHTQELMKIYPQLKDSGFEMIGVSPDSVESSKTNAEKVATPFPLFSDSKLDAAVGFGLAFKVDDATVTKYKGFGIDLEKASGQTHHALPIPAVYIVSRDGIITFAHSDPNYRERLDAKELLKEIER